VSAVRLALGTLTIVPVRPPAAIDRRVAGWAMTITPLVGLLLAVVPVGLLSVDGPPLLLSALAVASLAVLSRAMHLDGLADTADGLGSGRRAAEALAIMRKSDIGPFGVATLVLTLLVQVSALAAFDDEWAAGAAIVVSRAILPLVCTPAFRSARPDGLGAAVAGSVAWWQAGIALLVSLGFAVAVGAPYALVGVPVGLALAAYCSRRFGGVTGDVYGACVEVTLAASLVGVVLLP
jgi:adenosylcobinamide-GDP ribazoletransferase